MLRGKRPKIDVGKEVRRILPKLRSVSIENFNQHFKGIFGPHAQVLTKGLVATRRFVLGAVFVYQLALLYRFEQGLHPADLNVGLKAFLKAACLFMSMSQLTDCCNTTSAGIAQLFKGVLTCSSLPTCRFSQQYKAQDACNQRANQYPQLGCF